MMDSSRSIKSKWIYWFLVVDIIFALATILIRYIPSEADITGYGTVRLLLRQMDLGFEMTVGAWWLGLHLFLAALIFYEVFSTQEGKNQFSWLFLSVVFLGLSVDEVGAIHERVFSSWGVIIGIFLLGAIPFVYAIWQLLCTKGSRKSAVLIIVGFGIMTLAVPLEYLQHHLNWPSGLLGLRIGFEESVEIFGALVCIIAAVQQRQDLSWSNSWSRVIPNPLLMRGLYVMLVSGFVLHVISSVFTSLFWEIGSWGSPSVFFPSFIFIILGSSCFWVSGSGNISSPKVWRNKSYILFATSLVSFYLVLPETTVQYFVFLGEITVSEKVITLWVTYISVLLYIIYHRSNISNLNKLKLFSFVLIVLIIAYAIGHQMAYSISSGIVSLLIGFIVLDNCYSVGFSDALSQRRDEGLGQSTSAEVGRPFFPSLLE